MRKNIQLHFFLRVGVVAAILLLISLYAEYHDFFSHVNDTADDRIRASQSIFTNVHVYSSFLREVAYALVISMIVVITLEGRAKEEQVKLFEEKLDRINTLHADHKADIENDVLLSVLKKRVPNSISDLALDILISQRVIRNSLYIKYVLKPLPIEGFPRHIFVEVSMSYRLENISSESISTDIKVAIPNPSDNRLLGQVNIVDLAVEDSHYSDDEREKGRERILDTPTEQRAAWAITLDPGQEKKVAIKFQMIKELSDNDVWTTLYPTTSGQYEVVVEIPGLTWSVDALHSGRLQPADGTEHSVRVGGTCVYNLEKGLLPFQGILLWWRPDTSVG